MTRIFCLLMLSLTAWGQQTILTSKMETELPAGIMIPGKVKQLLRYTDKTGENVVALSSTGLYFDPYRTHEAEGFLWNTGQELQLYAVRYQLVAGTPVVRWQLTEAVYDCAMIMDTDFYPEATQVTDLDNNGTAEIWLMYRKSCQWENDPADLLVVMHHGEQRHVMRGHTRIKDVNGMFSGGDYRFDAAFRKAAPSIRNHAVRLWAAH